MHRKTMFLLAALVLFLVAWLVFIFPYQLHKVKDFKGIKIGNLCPGFFWVEDDLKEKNISKTTAFFILFISDEVPPEADGLDDTRYFEKTTDIILNKGGHFWSSADGKAAKAFGINPIFPRDKSVWALVKDVIGRKIFNRKRSDKWALDESLVVVTNGKGKILAMYKNAQLDDIKRIITELAP